MEMAELEKEISKFTAKLKPVSLEMKQMAAGVAEEVPLAAPVAGPEPCLHKGFLDLIHALPETFIGRDGGNVKEVIESVLSTFSVCKGGV